MEAKNQVRDEKSKNPHRISAFLVILIAFVISELLFYFFLGKSSNFENNNSNNHPVNFLGIMFKGGFVVPVILTLLLTVIILSIERFFAIKEINGEGNLINFVYDINSFLKKGNISEAESLCTTQKGSIAAVMSAGLKEYKKMESVNISNERKIERIKIGIEEATALQLPSMQQNLSIIATISTLSTLIGLFGTVLGMIKSFRSLGVMGAIDSITLSVGISEALVNTATGIATSILAIISYSYFSNRIDNITYAIDELGFTLTQVYSETHIS